MRYIFAMFAVFAIGLSILTACGNAEKPVSVESAKTNANAVKTNEPESAENAPRITLAEAKKDFDAGNAVFVDTRSEVSYRQEHIKGAINIPAEAMKTRYKEIPPDKKIIAYCS